MPFSPFHASVAYNAWDLFCQKENWDDELLGYFLVGAISPDSYTVTDPTNRQVRDVRHFNTGDYNENLFDKSKNFLGSVDVENSNKLNKAFILGYCNHLIVDNVYVNEIYRKYFGVDSIFEKKPKYHDILRLFLDICVINKLHDEEIIDSFNSVDFSKIELGFIDSEEIKLWTVFTSKQVYSGNNILNRVNSFAGEKKRFENLVNDYLKEEDVVKKVISKEVLDDFLRKINEAMKVFIAKDYYFNEIITIKDLN